MTPSRRRPLRRLATLVLTSTVLVGTLAVAAPAGAADPVSPADAALDWLSSELLSADGLFTVTFDGVDYPDPGVTIDAVLALAAGGKGAGEAASLATDAVLADVGSYTGTAWGEAYAGAVGKALLLALVQGEDPGGLEATLRGLMQPDGDEAGRFSDDSPWGDFSNVAGHAFDVLALVRTGGGVPPEAVAFLLEQQCPAGGFRLYLAESPDDPVGCTNDAQADPDATALTLFALGQVASPEVTTAGEAARTWLLSSQQGSGAFVGTGAANSNTTGLVAAAVRAGGSVAAADAAAGFVASLQRSACDDFGAIAYDQADFAAGVDGLRSTWRRATAQGVLALGLPTYGDIGTVAPVDPGLPSLACAAGTGPPGGGPAPAPGQPSITLTSTTIQPGQPIEGTASGFTPGEDVVATLHSEPVVLGTLTADDAGAVAFSFSVPAGIESGQHRLELVGQTSGVTVSIDLEILVATAAGTLPATGGASVELTAFAIVLLAAGRALVGVGRARALRATGPLGPKGV